MPPQVQHFDIGDRWTPTAVWKVGTVPTDPSQIVVKQLDAAGVLTTITTASSPSTLTSASSPLARTGTGTFQLLPGIALTAAGYWKARFEGTGQAEASEDFTAIVDPSEFSSSGGLSTRALVGLGETKDWLNENTQSTAEDLEIVGAINAVSEAFHFESGREFKVIGTNPLSRSFFIDQLGAQRIVSIGDLADTVGISVQLVSSTDWTTVLATYGATDFIAWPEVRSSEDPITRLLFKPTALRGVPGQRLRVTGNFGYPSVPRRVRQSVLESIGDLLDRDVEHYRQDESAAGGEVSYVAQQTMFLPLPPRALGVARSYQHIGVG